MVDKKAKPNFSVQSRVRNEDAGAYLHVEPQEVYKMKGLMKLGLPILR